MGSMSRSVDVTVTGRVQGVFFRARTHEQADRLGVRGWVRNEPDGSVGAHFEGPAEAVDEMVAWCRRGPAYARVEHVAVTEVAPTGDAGFRVAN
jgi:acylphosphatase